ncbi:MAG: hydrogenase expression/formation protein HypE [Solirubrobacterales bacterium]
MPEEGRPARREEEVLEAIERRRRRPPRRLLAEQVTLSHGAGGRATRDLVEGLFLRHLSDPALARLEDAAVLGGVPAGEQAVLTTDSYVVSPIFFEGGDIGGLAVNGTVNDLAVAGARPLALSAGFVIEEGFRVADLERVAASIAAAAGGAGVRVAAADTKVVERGKADGLYLNTTGLGLLAEGVDLGPERVAAGDRVLVSGTIGDHGMAIILSRGELALEGDLRSDSAPLWSLVSDLIGTAGAGLRWMRDPTRGGVATVLVELALATGLGVALREAEIPVRGSVAGACEILGIDPLYVANEGKLIAVVAPERAADALEAMRSHPLGREAAEIGEIRSEPEATVVLETGLGGGRIVDMLTGDPLPRIC